MPACVIVGHGRSPEGKGWADRIDAVDCVVRMWDCGWQPPPDYGSRYDYGVIEIGAGLVEKAMRHKQRDPAKGWIASLLHGKATLPANTEIVDQTPWNRIGRKLGGIGATGRLQFTRGTIAACWAIEKGLWGEVVLVGFDVIHRGRSLGLNEDFCPEYQKNPGTFSFSGWTGGKTKAGNHDFVCERKVMKRLADDNGVQLSFAQEIWT